MSAVNTADRPATETGAAPPGTRFRRPGWRDPRLLVGLVLVCLSVVLGARVLGAEDEMTSVWALEADVAQGQPITSSDVRPARVGFDQADEAAQYLAADRTWSEVVARRDLSAGELVPASAVGTGEPELAELPLAAPGAGVPIGLSPGDRVDVWSVPLARSAVAAQRGRQVLSDVPVLRVGSRGLGGPDSARQVVVGVPQEADLAATVGRLTDSHLVLVRRH